MKTDPTRLFVMFLAVSLSGACIEPPPRPPILPASKPDADAAADAQDEAESETDSASETDAVSETDAASETVSETDAVSDLGADLPPDSTLACLSASDCDAPAPCHAPATCDAAAGCVYEPLSDAACDDGDLCTSGGTCVSGACQPGAPLDCSAFDLSCYVGVCNPANGTCGSEPLPDGTLCDDGDPCTVDDACKSASCESKPKPCSDFNLCTTDACEPTSGACVHENVEFATVCSDGDACTASDGCQAGQCVGYPTKPMQAAWWTRIGGPETQYPPRVLSHEDESVTLVGIASGDWEVGMQPQPPYWPVATPDLDIAFVRLNSAGGVVWSRPLGGATSDFPIAVAAGTSGRVHLAAWMSPEAQLGTKTTPFSPSDLSPGLNMVLATFDKLGDLAWAMGLEGFGKFEAVAALPGGGVRALIAHREQVRLIDASGGSPQVLPADGASRDTVWLADFDDAGILTHHARMLFLHGLGYAELNSRPTLIVDATGATYILHLGWEQVDWGEGAQATGYSFAPGTGAVLLRLLPDFSIDWGVVIGFPSGAEFGRSLSMVPTADGVAIAVTSTAGAFVLSSDGGGVHSMYPEDAPPSKTVLIASLASDGAITGSLGALRAATLGMWPQGDATVIALSSTALTDVTVPLKGVLRVAEGAIPLSAGTTTLDVVTFSSTGQLLGMQPIAAPEGTYLSKVGFGSILARVPSAGVLKADGNGLTLPPADGVDAYIVKIDPKAAQSCP